VVRLPPRVTGGDVRDCGWDGMGSGPLPDRKRSTLCRSRSQGVIRWARTIEQVCARRARTREPSNHRRARRSSDASCPSPILDSRATRGCPSFNAKAMRRAASSAAPDLPRCPAGVSRICHPGRDPDRPSGDPDPAVSDRWAADSACVGFCLVPGSDSDW